MPTSAERPVAAMDSPAISPPERIRTLKAARQLILPFFYSEQRWKAGALVAVIVGAASLSPYIAVQFAKWTGRSMDALARYDAVTYWKLLPQFGLVVVALVGLALIQLLARSTLEILWRTWLTDRFLHRWLARETFYRIERGKLIDNPDQRITEDIDQLITHTFTLTVGLITTVGQLLNFSYMLWSLSGPLSVGIAGGALTIPGYLFWVALVYAALTTWITHLVSRAMMRLNFNRQRAEAEFRFMMVGVREYAEQIALYHGTATEIRRMRDGFEAVRRNFWQLVNVNMRFTAIHTLWAIIGGVIPLACSAQRYFAHAITLGDMTQLASAFSVVSGALSWFIQNYDTVQNFRVVVARLHGLELVSEPPAPEQDGVDYRSTSQPWVMVSNLALRVPQGTLLNRPVSLTVKSGERWLVKGESGVGKSTLMRALAGIWPYGSGQICMPAAARMLFLSQKNYVPPGTLKAALCYPLDESAYDDEACQHALIDVRLSPYVSLLHETDRWGQRLSPGEQQRVALGRAILQKPNFLFLDEATSALDGATEDAVYQALLLALPNSAIVHVSHHDSLDRYHHHVLRLQRADG
jgi:putative ATP-binding cassette transporter